MKTAASIIFSNSKFSKNTTSTSVTLSATGNVSIAKPISTELACGLDISNKVNFDSGMQKFENFNKKTF